MLTSAYFNSEVGDLRETLAAYQIKTNNDINKHRAIFIGGKNYRNEKSSVNVDVNVGNYPLDVADTDTNTGYSWKEFKGIPNITLKGNTFLESMPLYPLTLQNKPIYDANESNTLSTNLNNYSNISSLMDAVELLKNIFGLKSINTNLLGKDDSNLNYNTTNKLGNTTNLNTVLNSSGSDVKLCTELSEGNKHVYISVNI